MGQHDARDPTAGKAGRSKKAKVESESETQSLAARRLADLEGVFAALAHEQRRHILLTLRFRGGEMTAGDIAARFACSWPTTTRHLRVLEGAALVSVEKRGRERVYKLHADRLLGVVGDWIDWFRPWAERAPPRLE